MLDKIEEVLKKYSHQIEFSGVRAITSDQFPELAKEIDQLCEPKVDSVSEGWWIIKSDIKGWSFVVIITKPQK